MSIAEKLIRKHLKDLVPYSSARDDYSTGQGIFLDANENSIGSIGMGHWNRYPDPYQLQIKQLLKQPKGVEENQIFLGNGSDEPIDLLIRAFCEPGEDEIMIFPPTYGMYSVSANINNVTINEVLLNDDFQIDLERFDEKINERTKLVFICSPNNPTGNLMDAVAIKHVLENTKGLVIVDEAYVDFCNSESWISKLSRYDNLVILQTFSKAWGLASLRMGMTFANEDIISVLTKIKPPYNISGPVQEMIFNALRYTDVKRSWVDRLNVERQKLFESLPSLDIVEQVYPSDANFLLVKIKNARSVYTELTDQNIIVRDRSTQPLCDDCLRITVGTDNENQKLITALTTISQKNQE